MPNCSGSTGQSSIDPTLSRELFSQLTSLSKVKRPTALSERELRVLQLIAVGTSLQRIADPLFMRSRTVKRELHNIYNKLGAKSGPTPSPKRTGGS